MKKLAVSLLFTVLTISVKAQEIRAFYTVGACYLKNESYQRFLDSYVQFSQPEGGTLNFDQMMRFGHHFGATFGINKMMFELGYQSYNGQIQNANFNYGSRIFYYDYHSFTTVSGFYLGEESKRFRGNIGLIIGLGNTSVRSSFIYSNGIESMGDEKMLNGVFDQFCSELGLQLGFTQRLSERIQLNERLAVSQTAFNIEMEYHSYVRSISAGSKLEYLPEDYASYMVTGYDFDYTGEYVKPKAIKANFQIGLTYLLFEK